MAEGRPRRVGPGGEIVPGWRVVRVLGGGALTEVVLATDGRRDAVVKAARPGRESRSRASLESEGRLLASLAGIGLPRLLAAATRAPVPHLVVEYVDGRRLSSRVRRSGPLEMPAVAATGLRIARTLAAMHERDVVHLDVKPGNVVLGRPARLVDLGGARSLADAVRTRRPVGTRRWMSPEQRDPEAFGGMGPEADVWGLGATLHLAAVGRGPFDHLAVEREPDEDGRARRDYPVTVEDVAGLRITGEVAAGLADLVRSCLAWEPDRRPRMHAVVASLEEAARAGDRSRGG